MKWSVLLLLLAGGLAAFWYSRRGNSRSALQAGSGEAYRLQASAGNHDRPQAPTMASSSSAPRPGQGGILQEAADTASGKRYEEAADQLEAKAADLAKARKEAEQAAARLSGHADEALANVQAAAMQSGSVPGDGTTACPPDYPVKGNASSRLYHLPSSPNYAATIPEFCFADAEAAEAAGYSAPKR